MGTSREVKEGSSRRYTGSVRWSANVARRTRWLISACAQTTHALFALVAMASACAKNTTARANPTPVSAAPVVAATVGLAVVPVQVTYVLRALRPALDSLFPARDSLDQAACNSAAGLVCHQYVYRRDSLRLSADGDQLSINTALSFRAQVGMAGLTRLASCGYQPESMRRATLAISTALFWRKDWRIGVRGTTAVATLLDPCKVTVLGVDATTMLKSVINGQLQQFAAQADTVIPRVADMRPLADSLWKSFLEPTALDSTNTLWLSLEPEAVRVTPFVGQGPSIHTAIVLYARPHVVAGARPKAISRTLPELSLGEAPAHFDVPITVELPFAELQRRAATQLAIETASSSVKVDSVHLRGSGDTVTVELQVSGALRGTLTLASRLRWDASVRELRLDDLEWNLASKGALSRVKATLGAPIVSRAVRRATMGGRVPLGAQLDAARLELLRKLNGPMGKGIALGSSVQDIQIISVRATGSGIVVQARLTGQAGVWIQ